MPRRVTFECNVFAPTKFGEGSTACTVDWEFNRRREMAAERAAERALKNRQPPPELEPRLDDYGVADPLTTPWRRLFAWIGRCLNRL